MIPLNLKTNAGRCAPLALGQNAAIPEFTIPTDLHSGVAYTRPPIADRACCAGDDGTEVPAPYFTPTEGEGPQLVVPDPSWSASTLNLRTNAGRCAPLALNLQSAAAVSTSLRDVTGDSVEVIYTRPPLRDRACCAGDDGEQEPMPIFIVIPGCQYIALEDDEGLFALEDESGYFALECAH